MNTYFRYRRCYPCCLAFVERLSEAKKSDTIRESTASGA